MSPYDIETVAPHAKALGSSTLYEACGLPTAVDPSIRPVWRGALIAAPAFPLACAPGDNLALHLALEQAPRGSVLVVSTGNYIAGYWGEVLTVAAQAAGVVGLVIDGGVRDIQAIEQLGFAVFSRGVSVKGTVKATALSVGQPMFFNGAQVAAGDLVVADADGIVIIPQVEVPRTLAEGQVRFDKEARMMAALREGRTTVELLGLKRPEAIQ